MNNKLLNILFQGSSLENIEIKEERSEFGFIPNGIKYHQLNKTILETIDMPSKVYYCIEYDLIKKIWKSINKDKFESLDKNIRLGKIICYDYDKNLIGVEKEIINNDYSFVITQDLASIKDKEVISSEDSYLNEKYEKLNLSFL